MTLSALLWDVDGTLVDNEVRHLEAFNAAFAAAGLGWHWDEPTYRVLLGVTGGRERIVSYVREHDPERAARPGFDRFVRDLHADKTRRYGALLDAGVELRPGVARLLDAAWAAGLPQAVVTTTSRVNVERLLARTLGARALERFATVVTGEQVRAKKPAPDLYLAALGRLGLPGPACLALEDTALGLRAARAAGVPVVITVSRYSGGDDFAGALAVVDRLGDPGHPAHVLAGDLHGRPCVDLDLLKGWHGELSNIN